MKKWKNVITAFGLVLWIGLISPEIFVDPAMGCFVNEEGEALTEDEAKQLFEELFLQEDGQIQIIFRSKIWEWFMKR